MGKKIFTCINCGNEYESRKENSKWCSKECQTEYRAKNRIDYQCDYCGVKMIVPKRIIDALENGERNGIYCSRECCNKSQITASINICQNCGNEYRVFKCFSEIQKFCSRECFDDFREKNARKNIPRICPVCGITFYEERKDPIYCSYKCSSIAQQKREQCTCEYCGKQFDRIVSEIEKNEHHYCNNICRILARQWNEYDNNILRENYKKISNREISKLLSKEYSPGAIKSQAGRLGLYESRLWSKEEIDILKNTYSFYPLNYVLEQLPKRTVPSIMHQAQKYDLKSYFYLKRKYTDEDDQYLRDNYLTLSNAELAEHLNRGENAIQQHLWKLNLIRPFDPKSVCYQNLYQFVRARIETWRNNYREQCDYRCCITGKRTNIIVHHCRSFNTLLEETIELLNFEIKDNFANYTAEELENFVINFLDLQEYYGEYVCVSANIHKIFHDIYGYGDNTMEQWNEFVDDYKSGKYLMVS